MIRFCDVFFSLLGLIVLSPIFVIIALCIVLDSRGGVFYRQVRVGRDGKDFRLFKFRSMASGADKKGLITVGAKDSRVTRVGYFLRKYKLDELPQLLNVVRGEMSLVGPRPEVRKYVDMYTVEQRIMLLSSMRMKIQSWDRQVIRTGLMWSKLCRIRYGIT